MVAAIKDLTPLTPPQPIVNASTLLI